jgi:hypothetical protein
MSENTEAQTAEEELTELVEELTNIPSYEDVDRKNQARRLVDVIKELVEEVAGEKADELIAKHLEDYDHDLMYT